MKHFKRVIVAGTVVLSMWTSATKANEVVGSDNVFSDVGLTDFSGITASDIATLSETLNATPPAAGATAGSAFMALINELKLDANSFAGKMPKFSISVGGLLAALSGASVPSSDKSRVAAGEVYYLANAQAAPALAGGYSPAKIAATAGHVANDGEKMNDLLDKMIDDKNRIDPLLVGPTGKQGIAVANDLGGFIKELQKIPDAKMKGKIATTMDAVADGTDDLLASLEKIVPVLAKLGKKINSSVN